MEPGVGCRAHDPGPAKCRLGRRPTGTGRKIRATNLYFEPIDGIDCRIREMIDSSVARERAQESFAGFPDGVKSAYLAFAETGDMAALDTVVFGILQFYLPKKPAGQVASLPGSTRLIDDLGCDSLTMMDMVFLTEGLFDIKIDDAALPRILTLDDLRAHLRHLVQGTPSPA